MRIIGFVLSSLIFLSAAYAYEARVLIDETQDKKTFTGTMTLFCKKQNGHSCSIDKLKLKPGTWEFIRKKNQLILKNYEEDLSKIITGGSFDILGSFSLENRVLNKISFYFNRKNTDWVLYLPVDQYLYGVLAAEVPSSWPIESLKAQAIASRTYFLFKKQQRKKQVFDVRANTLDQVFKMDAKKHESIVEAVNQTHDQVLISKKSGEIFPAYFHADCGGGTSQEKVVWRKPTSLNVEVSDPFCKSASKNNWSYLVDKIRLTNILKSTFLLPLGVTLKSILPRVGENSRAHFVDFIFNNNIVKRLEANEFRRILGFANLRSTQFAVKNHWNTIEFEGRGFGHGVGLCQWGAQRWARKGKDYKEILSHYYPKARLKSVDRESMRNLHAEVH